MADILRGESNMSKQVLESEQSLDIYGVPGTLFRVPGTKGRWVCQLWVSAPRPYDEGKWGKNTLRVSIRFDDACNNGYNTFSMTAELFDHRERYIGGGCRHGDIANVFPSLAHLIKWHLCSTDAPLHYIANTVFLAGERDCWGCLAGEPWRFERRLRFSGSYITHRLSEKFIEWIESRSPEARRSFRILAVDHSPTPTDTYKYGPKYTFEGYDCSWGVAPFDDETMALGYQQEFATHDMEIITIPVAWGKGKVRELDAARRSGVDFDGMLTDEFLSQPKEVLTAALQARLPALLAAFRSDIEKAGFKWSPDGE